MKALRVKVGIKDIQTALNEFVTTGERLRRGEKVKKESGVYFTSLETFRRALTPKRFELLHVIKTESPFGIVMKTFTCYDRSRSPIPGQSVHLVR